MMAHPILINRPIVVTRQGREAVPPVRGRAGHAAARNAAPSPRRMASGRGCRRQPSRRDHERRCAVAPGKRPSMGTFERYLTLWVALCIVVGIGLGQLVPGLFHALGTATVAQINLPVAVLVWLMVIPMLLKIDLAALGQVESHWRGIVATVGINWLVKPFSMALLGWLFIGICSGPTCRPA